jgi:hypothetical protein
MSTRLLLLLGSLLALPGSAFGWTLKVHLFAANEVLQDAADDGKVNLGVYGQHTVPPDVLKALREHPDYFRAGALGPDGYPDIFTGQVFTHTDQSKGLVNHLIENNFLTCAEAESRGWCVAEGSTPACVAGTGGRMVCHEDSSVDALVPYAVTGRNGFDRPKSFWRSIDWAHFLIDKAYEELRAAKNQGPAEQLKAYQALAFSYGYLTHYAGDGFGHAWVNLYAGGSWNYYDEYPEREYRHVIVEGYVQHVMETSSRASPGLPPELMTVSIAAPEWFVEKYLMKESISGEDSAGPGAKHIRLLYGYKALLEQLRERTKLSPGEMQEFGGANFDVRDPQNYSSMWSYILNRCAAEVVMAPPASQSTCYGRLYRLALAKYVETRLQKVDEALVGWVQLSTRILEQGFLSPEGFEPLAIRELMKVYYETKVLPLVIPAEDEPLYQFFSGVSCVDVGPLNFQRVCQAIYTQVGLAIQSIQTELDAKLRVKLADYYKALDLHLCILEYYLDRLKDPEVRMNFAYCGQEVACQESTTRKAQVADDLFIASTDPRTFIPYSNTVKMSKLGLLDQAQVRDVAMLANLIPLDGAPPIPLDAARFLNDNLYEQILYESIATLDGSPPIKEDELANPRRVLFDQFRKPPMFGPLLSSEARDRLHWPLFEVRKMDPDGDQITLTFDLCPCWPETRTQNALDADNDRVGDSCDGDTLFPRAAQTVQDMDDAGFGPPSLGFKRSFVNRLNNTVVVACGNRSTAEAINLLDNMLAEIRAHTENGLMQPATAQAVKAVVDELLAKFHANSVQCVDTPPVGSVTSCNG